MFSQEAVVKFLQDAERPMIVSLLPSLLARASQLSTEQHAGLLFACLVFGGVWWDNAIMLLKAADIT